MAKKTFIIEKKDPTHKQIWEWEETNETVKALKNLKKFKKIDEST